VSALTRLAGLLLGAALALSPARASAAPSPVTGSFELRAGGYRPAIDPVNGSNPYQLAFGDGRPYGFSALVGRCLPWRTAGTVELGLGAGYWSVKGHGVDSSNLPTAEQTALKIIPIQLALTWRADFLYDRYGVPVVPYGRASLLRYSWRVTGSGGTTTKTGVTDGFGLGGGVAFVLDFIDPVLARELDLDSGVNHTMLTFDVAKTWVNDFGSGKSWNLSDTQLTYTFGLLFVF